MKLKLLTSVLVTFILTSLIYVEHYGMPSGLQAANKNNNSLFKSKAPKAPDFKFNLINKNVSNNLYNIKANKIIIHFWASWCNICISEFTNIIDYAKHHPKTTILAISIDGNKQDLDQYLNKLSQNNNINTINNNQKLH